MPTSSTFITQAKRVTSSFLFPTEIMITSEWYNSILPCSYAVLFKELKQAVSFSVPLTLADMLI